MGYCLQSVKGVISSGPYNKMPTILQLLLDGNRIQPIKTATAFLRRAYMGFHVGLGEDTLQGLNPTTALCQVTMMDREDAEVSLEGSSIS